MEGGQWSRIEDLFHQAAELPPADRPAFLDQVCGDDQELRREVESLLAADVAEEGLIEAAVGRAAEPFPTATDAGAAGRRIGPYQILREIGHGGMGTVYLAERADGQYRKQVAIKLVSPHLGTEEILRRFRNERQVQAFLDHPNIARLLDGGATEDGLPYLVMEYVDGVRIDSWCDGRKLPVRDRLKLFRQVCAAVQSAHDKEIIHRDIKPGNILVTPDGTPKLLDFGIAKVLNPGLAEPAQTTIGPGPMTPEYASPEQIRGQRVGPASDIYSLGVVLYQLLTGRTPYTAQGGDLWKAICEQEPVAPSKALRADQPTSLRRQLAGDLDNIVLKALRKEPERRYSSVAQFSEDVDRFLKDLPVQARQETLAYRGIKFVKRNRVPVMTAAVSTALILALVTGLQRFGPSSGGAAGAVRSIAVLPLENLSHDPEQEPLVEGMTDALIGDLGKIGSLRVISRESVMRYKGVRKSAAQTARELNASALVAGAVQSTGDRVRVTYRLTAGAMDRVLWTQTYERELQGVPAMESDVARAIAREIQIQLTPQEEARLSSSSAVNRQAYEACLRGRYQLYKHTREGNETGLQHFKDAIDIDPAYAPAWAGLADAYYELSTAVLPAREAMPKARAAALKALAIDGTLVEAHATLAQIQSQYDWDWATAEKSYNRALELNPSYAQGHLYYGWYLAERGQMEDAIRETAEAQRLDPLPPWRATNLAWIYYLARRTDQAIVQFRKILELDPKSAVTHYSLGSAYVAKKMFEPGIAEFLKGQALDVNCCLVYLGHAYAVSGQRDLARHILEKLLGLSKHDFVDSYGIGVIYAGLGEKDKAFEWLEKAYQERSEELLFLKVAPVLDPLRADPRFSSLVRRIGLPP